MSKCIQSSCDVFDKEFVKVSLGECGFQYHNALNVSVRWAKYCDP